MSELGSDRRAARRAARERNANARPQSPSQHAAQPEEKKRRSNFISESYAELKKVEWPDQKAVISGTTVVIIACIIVGTYLWLNDELWKYVVKHVLLG